MALHNEGNWKPGGAFTTSGAEPVNEGVLANSWRGSILGNAFASNEDVMGLRGDFDGETDMTGLVDFDARRSAVPSRKC